MVMEVVHEDMGEDSMHCTNHPYKNSIPGGICAFCLQEKLGKLVSSSYPVPVFPSSSSSSSPSFRSASAAGGAAATGPTLQAADSRRASRLPFVLTHKKKKKKDVADSSTSIVFKRSKSTATPRRRGVGNVHLLDQNFPEDSSPNRRGFWKFLYSSSKHSSFPKKDSIFPPPTHSTVCSSSTANTNNVGPVTSLNAGNNGGVGVASSRSRMENDDDNYESPDENRKVSRSRSVGCGSRSFSSEFLERISTGFGDCTLRRVESQREGKHKVQHPMHRGANGQDYIKERVKCGGLFSGFMIASSNSSSSSSSSYWVPHSVDDSKSISATHHHLSHGRSKSWVWTFASPMRAFSSKPAKRDSSSSDQNKNATPNLNAIPSLLAVSG